MASTDTEYISYGDFMKELFGNKTPILSAMNTLAIVSQNSSNDRDVRLSADLMIFYSTLRILKMKEKDSKVDKSMIKFIVDKINSIQDELNKISLDED